MSITTAPLINNKYLLKSLEEEIGLFDRKLAHLHNFETFENEEARLVAVGKLSTKRERLVRTLRDLTGPAPEVAATPKKAKTAAKTKTSTRSKTRTASTAKDSPAAASAEAVAAELIHT